MARDRRTQWPLKGADGFVRARSSGKTGAPFSHLPTGGRAGARLYTYSPLASSRLACHAIQRIQPIQPSLAVRYFVCGSAKLSHSSILVGTDSPSSWHSLSSSDLRRTHVDFLGAARLVATNVVEEESM